MPLKQIFSLSTNLLLLSKNFKRVVLFFSDFHWKIYPCEKNWKFNIVKIPCGGSPLSNPHFWAKPKLSVFENGQFSEPFFYYQKFSKKCKMLCRKSFGIFFDIQKKLFLNFFSKKVSWKKFFLSVKKLFKTFPPQHFAFFLNFSAQKKKCPLNCPFSKTDSFGFSLKDHFTDFFLAFLTKIWKMKKKTLLLDSSKKLQSCLIYAW